MNYIPTLRVITARFIIEAVIRKQIDKQQALLAICDEEFTYLSNSISPYSLGFESHFISGYGIIISLQGKFMYIVNFKVGNNPKVISLPGEISTVCIYRENVLIITRNREIYYIGKSDKEPRLVFRNENSYYRVQSDLTMLSNNKIIIPSSGTIIDSDNIITYINVEGCYFVSTSKLVKVGISPDNFITIEGDFSRTIETDYENEKLYFSSDIHHYYGSPGSLKRIDRKSGDEHMHNCGFYYNSNDYCCYLLREEQIIKIEKVIEYDFMIISQADSGVRIFNAQLGMYVGFISGKYWFEYDNDEIENVRIELTYNGYFIVRIQYNESETEVIECYSYEGLALDQSNNSKCIFQPLGVTPLSLKRCLELLD